MATVLSAVIEALKVLPGVVLFPFSAYFIWRKIGNSIGVSFSYGMGGFSANRIISIVFTNRKDKPLPIFSAFLLINKDLLIPVEKFNPPLVLRGLEVMQIETSPFSTYYLGNEKFEITPDVLREAEFYVMSTRGKIRCEIITTQDSTFYAYRNNIGIATKSTSKFNGHVYNDHVLFAISYLIDGKQQTAFVAKSGFIGGEWEFRYNMIPQNALTEKGILEFIQKCGYDKLFQGMVIDKLQERFVSSQSRSQDKCSVSKPTTSCLSPPSSDSVQSRDWLRTARDPYLSFLRNLTPQVFLASLAWIAASKLDFLKWDLSNLWQTAGFCILLILFGYSVWSNATVFLEELFLDFSSWLKDRKNFLKIQRVSRFQRLVLLIKMIIQEKKLEVLFALLAILATEIFFAGVIAISIANAANFIYITYR
ncbi:MAG: hypothetical protein LBV44_05660 [Methylobacillus sp.]|jgi:hypothetical protein|nr:hypothetical protein [Methylobacillus sp.]